MPDTVTEGPWVDLFRRMGMQGAQDRYRVTGQQVGCVCLLHGTTPARVLFSVAFPQLGHGVLGRPVLLVAIQVWCWPSCGYRLTWLDDRS